LRVYELKTAGSNERSKILGAIVVVLFSNTYQLDQPNKLIGAEIAALQQCRLQIINPTSDMNSASAGDAPCVPSRTILDALRPAA